MKNKSTLEKEIFERYRFLVPLLCAEFDGTAEKEISKVAEDALRAAIKGKLDGINEVYASSVIRLEITKYLARFQVPVEISLDAPISQDNPYPIGSTLRSVQVDPLSLAFFADASALCEATLAKFSEPASTILRMRLLYAYEGLDRPATFPVIAKRVGLSVAATEKTYKALLHFIESVRIAGTQLIPKEFAKQDYVPVKPPENHKRLSDSAALAHAYAQET